MKKTKLILTAALITFSALSSFAQDVKEIVTKHNQAIGGTESWGKVTSMTKTGTMTTMGMDMPFSTKILKGKGMRQDFTVMGAQNYAIITPTAGWIFMPAQGQTQPQPMPAEQLKDVAEQLDFQDKLMDAAAKKYTMELLGKEDINGSSCFKVKVTDAGKAEHIYFVDAKTWYLVKVSEKASVQGQDMEVVTEYSGYTKLPSGIVVPMKESSGDAGTVTYSKIETNTDMPESIFKP